MGWLEPGEAPIYARHAVYNMYRNLLSANRKVDAPPMVSHQGKQLSCHARNAQFDGVDAKKAKKTCVAAHWTGVNERKWEGLD